jgi:hypothetical protein
MNFYERRVGMKYLGLAVGVFLFATFLWMVWKLLWHRRLWNPVPAAIDAARNAMRCKGVRWYRNNPGEYRISENGVKLVLTVSGKHDEISIEQEKMQLLFTFYEGALTLLQIDKLVCDTYHTLTKTNALRCSKFLDDVRRANRLKAYSRSRDANYEGDLRERKEKADAHRASIEEKMNRGKEKHE